MKEIICPYCGGKAKVEPLFRHRLYIGDACKKESWEKVIGRREI
ncbi:MAG: hypothetical protein KatS3mg096_782 [Candidatus Parcubacteria bacterium]|nr:MAG: hypothetical protein KatS3mg096_782 [Candidatus Parcubacteria bacterium]